MRYWAPLILTSSFIMSQFLIAGTNRKFNFDFDHVPSQLIVKFKPGFQQTALPVLLRMKAKTLYSFQSSGAQLLTFAQAKNESDLYQLALALNSLDYVEYVEANTIMRIKATHPNDPLFEKAYGLHNDGTGGGIRDADIDAPEAWDIETGSPDVRVAIIDTGVDYLHPDLSKNYWQNPGELGVDSDGKDKRRNGVDDDGNGFVDDFQGWDFANNDNDPADDLGHGTHCAGVIGGSGNDGSGISGVNWNVSLVGIKFIGKTGAGDLASAIRAIDYATSLGVTVTNNSWGGGGYSESLKSAIKRAEMAGIVFVAAAGNSARNNDGYPHYPGSYDLSNIIAVAASDRHDRLAEFSSYGMNSVALAAPGVDILSTVPERGYTLYSGTSMAAPYVTGAVALVKSHYPRLSGIQIIRRILSTTDPKPDLAKVTRSGGRLNLFNALENDLTAPGIVANIVVGVPTVTSFPMSWAQAGDDGDDGMAHRYEIRTARTPIKDQSDWMLSHKHQTVTRVDGDRVSTVLQGFFLNTSGYVAIRAIDNAGNAGPISESIWFQLKRVRGVSYNPADSTDEVEMTGAWGIESIGDNNYAFSDSPAGPYENSQESHLLFPKFELFGGEYFLVFDTKYLLEQNYDIGYIELKSNGSEWSQIGKFTGAANWYQIVINLSPYINSESTFFYLRLRLKSDHSVNQDGWLVDNLSIFQPE